MIKYIITTENGEVQETYTGKELYCQVLDKFKIKYKVDVKKEETILVLSGKLLLEIGKDKNKG